MGRPVIPDPVRVFLDGRELRVGEAVATLDGHPVTEMFTPRGAPGWLHRVAQLRGRFRLAEQVDPGLLLFHGIGRPAKPVFFVHHRSEEFGRTLWGAFADDVDGADCFFRSTGAPVLIPARLVPHLPLIAAFEADPGARPAYHDWCLENGWGERAAELAKGLKSPVS